MYEHHTAISVLQNLSCSATASKMPPGKSLLCVNTTRSPELGHSKPLVKYEDKLRTCFKDAPRQTLLCVNTTRSPELGHSKPLVEANSAPASKMSLGKFLLCVNTTRSSELSHSKLTVKYENKLRTRFKDVPRQVLAMCKHHTVTRARSFKTSRAPHLI